MSLWVVEYRLPSGLLSFRVFDAESPAWLFVLQMEEDCQIGHVKIWDLFAREKEPSQ